MRLIRKRRMQETVELNITAFLNLMVILVPFLLITAVFSRMTVLELNLPALAAKQSAEKDMKLQLQIVVTAESISVEDNNLGLLKKIMRNEKGELNWSTLKKTLIEIKTRFPDEKNITLIITPEVRYKTMIEIIDHVRYTEVVNVTSLEVVELFPNVSIADAVNDTEASIISETVKEPAR